MSLVLIRVDKIGDLIATMSVDQHPSLTASEEISWVIAKGLGVIAEQATPKRKYLEISAAKTDWKKAHRELLQFLKEKKPKAVIVFHGPWWVSLACWQAGIPLRVGRASQWHSFLFFNRRLRQTRSQSEKHENDYNRELLEYGLKLPTQKIPPLHLKTQENSALLQKHDLSNGKYVVVHPGMFGSALNWPQERYSQLIDKLLSRMPADQNIVLTGTTDDERFLTKIKADWAKHPQVKILQAQLTLKELIEILSTSKAVIAPSTGVLHLAAALGKKVVGIYSPILAHHPRRWRPLGENASFVLPEVNCPAALTCLGDQCSFYPCMNSISVEAVIAKMNGKN